MPEFTKKIHLVWIGDLPPKHVKSIIAFCTQAKRNGYEVILWTNHPVHAFKTIEDNNFSVRSSGLSIKNIDELFDDISSNIDNSPELRKIWAKVTQIIKMECAGASYNYATASDFLRLLILYQYGGIYSDLDAMPIRPFPSYDELNHITTKGLMKGPGNAFLVAKKKDPVLIEVIEQMLQQCAEAESTYCRQGTMTLLDLKRLPLNYPTSERRSESVSWGPGSLYEVIIDHQKGFTLRDNNLIPSLFNTEVEIPYDIHPEALNIWLDTYRHQEFVGLGEINFGGNSTIWWCENDWIEKTKVSYSTTEHIDDPHRHRVLLHDKTMLRDRLKILCSHLFCASSEVDNAIDLINSYMDMIIPKLRRVNDKLRFGDTSPLQKQKRDYFLKQLNRLRNAKRKIFLGLQENLRFYIEEINNRNNSKISEKEKIIINRILIHLKNAKNEEKLLELLQQVMAQQPKIFSKTTISVFRKCIGRLQFSIEAKKWVQKDTIPKNEINMLNDAVYYGHIPLIVFLIQKGADPNKIISMRCAQSYFGRDPSLKKDDPNFICLQIFMQAVHKLSITTSNRYGSFFSQSPEMLFDKAQKLNPKLFEALLFLLINNQLGEGTRLSDSAFSMVCNWCEKQIHKFRHYTPLLYTLGQLAYEGRFLSSEHATSLLEKIDPLDTKRFEMSQRMCCADSMGI